MMRLPRVGLWSAVVLLLSAAGAAAAGAGDQRLVGAAKDADMAAVRALLQQRVDVNATEADGSTALHWAAQHDLPDMASLLIGAGADVKAATRYGVTPILLASMNGSAAILEALLKAGADPNSALPEGQTALMTAAATGKPDALKVLIAHGADVNATESWKGQTALMWAASENNADAARLLLEAGSDVQAKSKAGWTPLVFAARSGYVEVAKVLLAGGANANDGVVDIDPAADRQLTSRYFFPGTKPVNKPKDEKTSVMMLAMLNARWSLARLLLENGADPNAADPQGSMLHAIAWLRRPGNQNTAARTWAGTGKADSLELAKALLAHGANPNVRISWEELKYQLDNGIVRTPPNIPMGRVYVSFNGATPFYLAARSGDVALMRVLVAGGADPMIPTVQNVTPLMAAAGVGYWDYDTPGPLSGTPESERLEAVKLALELGNDINAVTKFHETVPLVGDPIELLYRYPENLIDMSEGGDPRMNGHAAIHGAALTKQNSIVQFLVDHGAKLDAETALGWTPLMIAEGIFVAQTLKTWPPTAEFIKKLMAERGLAIPRQARRDQP